MCHVTHREPDAQRGGGAKAFPLTIMDPRPHKDHVRFELSSSKRFQSLDVEMDTMKISLIIYLSTVTIKVDQINPVCCHGNTQGLRICSD